MNPCKLVDAPAVPPSSEVRFLTQEELVAVIDRGVRPGSSGLDPLHHVDPSNARSRAAASRHTR